MSGDLEIKYTMTSPRPGGYVAEDIASGGDTTSIEDINFPIGVQPGDVVEKGTSTEGLSYYYYSGSVFDHTEYKTYGYQNKFDWNSNVYAYMTELTTYTVSSVYVQVGTKTDSLTVETSYGVVNTYTGAAEPVYDWIENESNPTVDISISENELFTVPHSVGIIAEAYKIATLDASGIPGSEVEGIEMTYSNNDELSFNYITYEEEPVLEVRVDPDEANFIRNIFSYDVAAKQEMDNRMDTLTQLIYDSVNVSKNIFPTNDPVSIPSNYVGDISGQETAFSASVSTATTEGTFYA